MATKMKPQTWADKPRIEKLAGAMFPHLLSPEDQRGMLAANPEQRAGMEKRIDQGSRDYGKAKPNVPGALDRVAGLRRVEAPKAETTKQPWWK
jgi:hypothetical protein